MWIAHISDLHLTPKEGDLLYEHVDTRNALRQALAQVKRLNYPLDLLLLTGDLADGGEEGAYLFLRECLADMNIPVALLPGNHDCRKTLKQVFPEQFADWGNVVRHLHLDGASLLLLDTVVSQQAWGLVDDEGLLELQQQQIDGPCLLAMHHPPFSVDIPKMDYFSCKGEIEALGSWAAQQKIEGLLCGHIHRFISTSFHGIPARVAPSPAHQIALDPNLLAYTMEPGGFLLHHWEPGRNLLTHWVAVVPAPVHTYGE